MLGPRADAGVVGTGALTGGGPVAWGSGGWQLADARFGRCAGAACRRAGGCSAACDGAIPGAATAAARCRNGWIPETCRVTCDPDIRLTPDMANGVESQSTCGTIGWLAGAGIGSGRVTLRPARRPVGAGRARDRSGVVRSRALVRQLVGRPGTRGGGSPPCRHGAEVEDRCDVLPNA